MSIQLRSVSSQCPVCDATIISENLAYGLQTVTGDATTSPNWVALPNQNFILNSNPTCCPLTSCTLSGDSTVRMGDDGKTVEMDVSKAQGAKKWKFSVTCQYNSGSFVQNADGLVLIDESCYSGDTTIVPSYTGQRRLYSPGSGYQVLDSYTSILTISNVNCLLQECIVKQQGCASTRSDAYIAFIPPAYNLQIDTGQVIPAETVCFECEVSDGPNTFTYTVDNINYEVYCEVTPPSRILANTVQYIYDVTIVDSSPTITFEIDLGGQFTTTDSSACPLTQVNSANSNSFPYSAAAPFSSSLSYDPSSLKFSQQITPVSLGTFSFYMAAEASPSFRYFTNQFTVTLSCGASIVQATISPGTSQQVGINALGVGYQQYSFPVFTTNALCPISAYQVSSSSSSIVAIAPQVAVTNDGTTVTIRRQIEDGRVYDYNFYVHVGGSAPNVFGPYTISKFEYCVIEEVVPNTSVVNIVLEPTNSGFTDYNGQIFMTKQDTCDLSSCQILNQACSAVQAASTNLQFSGPNFQINMSPITGFTQTLCISCTYTDRTIMAASVTKVTNAFSITVQCVITPPSSFPSVSTSYDVQITDASTTSLHSFSFGGQFTISTSSTCVPSIPLEHASDANPPPFTSPPVFAGPSSSYTAPNYISTINLIPGNHAYYLQANGASVLYPSPQLFFNIYCNPSLIVPSTFLTSQSGGYLSGAKLYQRFTIPKFTSVNANCPIQSYTVSSQEATVVAMAELQVTVSATEVYIDREMKDGNLYQYDFYLHVQTSGDSFSGTKVTSQLSLTPFQFCFSADVTSIAQSDQVLTKDTGLVSLQMFTTPNALCQVVTCEVRESTCSTLLGNPNIYFDGSHQLNIKKAQVFSANICTFCLFTDSVWNFANFSISQDFKVKVEDDTESKSQVFELINRPPEFVKIPEKIEFQLGTQVMEYELPEIIDIEGDRYEIDVFGPSFMSYENGVIKFEGDDIWEQEVDVQLTDERNASEKYTFKFYFIKEEEPLIEEKVEEQKIVQIPEFTLSKKNITEEIELPICSVKINKVSPRSEAFLEFNTQMKTDFNISQINTDILEIYMKSENENTLNLTWSIIEYEGNSMIIKLNFTDTQMISTSLIYDELVVHFKDIKEFFVSAELHVNLSEQYHTVFSKVPRQLSDNALNEALISVSEGMMPIFRGTLIISLVSNILFAGILSQFLDAIRPLQLITHLLMLKIIVPANVMVLMEAILPISQYDYLEPFWSYFVIWVLQIDVQKQELEVFGGYQEVSDQILTLGYENQSSLLNLGTITLYFSIYIVKVLVFMIFGYALKVYHPEKYAETRDQIFFQDLIDIVTESFIELVISGYISIYQFGNETTAEILSKYVGFSSLILSSSALLMIKYQLKEDSAENLHFEGGLKENCKTQLHFFTYFFLRRTIFVLIIFSYNENTQLTFLLLLNIFSLIFLGHYQPYSSRSLNRKQLFYDWMVHLASFHMMFFTGITDYNFQETIGVSMMICILLMMAYSIFDVGLTIAKKVLLVGKKYYNRCKGSKNQVMDVEEDEDRVCVIQPAVQEDIYKETANVFNGSFSFGGRGSIPKVIYEMSFAPIIEVSDEGDIAPIKEESEQSFVLIKEESHQGDIAPIKEESKQSFVLIKEESYQGDIAPIKDESDQDDEYDHRFNTLCLEAFKNDRDHTMDLCRVSGQIDDFNLFPDEISRLESEKNLIEQIGVNWKQLKNARLQSIEYQSCKWPYSSSNDLQDKQNRRKMAYEEAKLEYEIMKERNEKYEIEHLSKIQRIVKKL